MPMILKKDSVWYRTIRVLHDPHSRYRYGKLTHAVRVSLGILVAFGVTSGFDIPYGVWTPVSMLIVIAGLQHHGTIRQRATQRAFGTVVGLAAGLFVILEQKYLGCTAFTWTLMAIFCGGCAYHAVGRGGYFAMLSAITLIIVAGRGTDPIIEGFWRAINVFLGIVIALLLSFALPIFATWAWRYEFAEALRGCKAVYAGLARGDQPALDAQLRTMAKISAALQRLRSLMPAVAQETGLPKDWLESVQRCLRIFLSLTEILLIKSQGANGEDCRRLSLTLATLASALECGSPACLATGGTADAPEAVTPADALPAECSPLIPDLHAELEQIRQKLAAAPRLWAK